MERIVPFTVPPHWPAIGPDRFARRVRTDAPDDCRIALLGLPDDLGVRLNNGRTGAKDGPAAFRRILASYGADYDQHAQSTLDVNIYDAGDIEPAPGDTPDALHETHTRITRALEEIHSFGLTPVCIGGGHDLTFPAIRALSGHVGGPVGGINIDPHLDVRETIGSGMPFRAAIEGGFLDAQRFVEFGVGRFSNSKAHSDYLRERFAALIPLEKARDFKSAIPVAFDRGFPAAKSDPGFVSLDLDVIDAAAAPGVSAPNPDGLSVERVLQVVHRAGEHPAVRHFDIMELSPPHDDNMRTARIAALCFLTFLSGFADRPS
ncbi:MAG: formimidoylglutamase [Phycisphaerales bacterium]